MAYDRADWHYGGNYPKELPPENGGTHIGFFLAWAITRNLEGEIHTEDEPEIKALQAVRDREKTGREFLFQQCDEKFWSDDLNEVGNQFAEWYYNENEEGRPSYLSDYAVLFSNDLPNGDIYYLDDTWENFEKIASVIDQRFKEWKEGIPPRPLNISKRDPWWKFWK